MSAKEQVEGFRFGNWTVLFRLKTPFVECVCDCGSRKSVHLGALKQGQSKSCGCSTNQFISSANTKHGGARRSGYSREYNSWRMMWERCARKDHKFYHNYGGRGIVICDRWKDFSAFKEDMGNRPEGMSLDRINTLGNYEPENCKWSTRREQNLNRRPYKHTKKRVYKNK